jgi:hypothetical protein
MLKYWAKWMRNKHGKLVDYHNGYNTKYQSEIIEWIQISLEKAKAR